MEWRQTNEVYIQSQLYQTFGIPWQNSGPFPCRMSYGLRRYFEYKRGNFLVIIQWIRGKRPDGDDNAVVDVPSRFEKSNDLLCRDGLLMK